MKSLHLIPLVVCAFLVGLAFHSSGADDNPEQLDPKNTTARWEHLALAQQAGDTVAETSRKINELGRSGWELVTVTDGNPGTIKGRKTYYFKRPL